MRAAQSLLVLGLTGWLVLGTLAAPAHAAPITVVVDGVTYTADDATVAAGATATDYDATFGVDVTIPATVDIGGTDYDVTAIGASAFAFDPLSSLTLPDTLTAIGDLAFAYNELTSLTVPDRVTAIGERAFAYNFLTSLTLPATLTAIGDRAFTDNPLTSVIVPDSVTTIGASAFFRNSLTSVTLPDSLTTIGASAFAFNDLTSLTLPAILTIVGADAFSSNPLTAVRFLGAPPVTLGGNVFTSDLLISYFWSFGDPQTAGGFTSPVWNGYRAQAIAIIDYDTTGVIDTAEAFVGETVTEPTAPSKDGYGFDGWFTAQTGGTAWSFATDAVAGDMTLFARFTVVPVPVLAATGGATLAVPAGIGSVVLLAGLALLLARRRIASSRSIAPLHDARG